MEKFIVGVDTYIQNNDPPVQFKETAFENSGSVLGSITVYSYYDYYSMNCWNFGPGTLDNLNNLTYLYLQSYDYDTGPFPPSVLISLQDLSFGGKGLYSLTYLQM